MPDLLNSGYAASRMRSRPLRATPSAADSEPAIDFDYTPLPGFRPPYWTMRGVSDRAKRFLLAALMALLVLNLWTGGPLLALWLGSRVQGDGPADDGRHRRGDRSRSW